MTTNGVGRTALCWRQLRASILGLCASLSGCLVSPPPDLEEPTRTPLYVHSALTVPSTERVLAVDSSPGRRFPEINVWIQSEDLGEKITGASHIDFGFSSTEDLTTRTLSAGDWQDGPRLWKMCAEDDVDQNLCGLNKIPDGCHQLTILFAHESAFDDDQGGRIVQEQFKDQSSSVVWWLNVGRKSADSDWPDVVKDCPRPEDRQGAGE